MMLLLVLNVSEDTGFVTRAHAENSVTGLPPEERTGQEVMLDEMRRTAFDMLHQSGEGYGGGHADK